MSITRPKAPLLALAAAVTLALTPSCARAPEPTGLAADYLLLSSLLCERLGHPTERPAERTRDEALAALKARADRLRGAGPLDAWVEELRAEAIGVCERAVVLLERPGPLGGGQLRALGVLTGGAVRHAGTEAGTVTGTEAHTAPEPADVTPDEWTALAERYDTVLVRLAPIADRIDPERQTPVELDISITVVGEHLRVSLTNRAGRPLPALTAAVRGLRPDGSETARTFSSAPWPDGETRVAHLRARPWDAGVAAEADSIDVRLSAPSLRSTITRAIRPAGGWPVSP